MFAKESSPLAYFLPALNLWRRSVRWIVLLFERTKFTAKLETVDKIKKSSDLIKPCVLGTADSPISSQRSYGRSSLHKTPASSMTETIMLLKEAPGVIVGSF